MEFDTTRMGQSGAIPAKATVINAAEVGGVKDGDNPYMVLRRRAQAMAQSDHRRLCEGRFRKKSDFDKLNDQWMTEEGNVEAKSPK